MKHVLLVDDNLTILKQVAAQLAGDYRVTMAKSGEQALALAPVAKPDLILLDVEMPGMNGFDTIARLKDVPALAHIPVIFLTANHDAETQVRALAAGGVDFVKKPFVKGVLIHRIDLHLRLSRYQLDLENTVRELQDGILTSFAEVIEYRDRFSGDHVMQTRKYVDLLGGMLVAEGRFAGELDAVAVDLFARASVLHDVGKIGVSDLIMLKPGRLTEEEYEEAKKHANIGGNTLEHIWSRTPMPILKTAAVIARRHHERYDGSGYPDGLSGTDIPLCARIVSVANVYDALVTETVFRSAMGHADACRIIVDGAGGEFDPVVAATFIANADAFAALAEKRGKGAT